MSDADISGNSEQKIFQALLLQISAARKLPLLTLIISYVSRESVFSLKQLLADKSYDELDVILNTPGGDINAAFLISKLLRKHAKKVNIIVPSIAKSAGTLICLAADEILLTELSELGPLDTQLKETQERTGARVNSALNGTKALEQVQQHCTVTLDTAIRLLVPRTGLSIGEVIQLATEFCGKTSAVLYSKLDPKSISEYARLLDIGHNYGVRILTKFRGWSEERANTVVTTLVHSYPSHGYVIDCDELLELGLPAKQLEPELEKIVSAFGARIPESMELIQMFQSPPPAEASKERTAPISIEKEKVQQSPSTDDNKGVGIPPNEKPKRKHSQNTETLNN